MSPPYRQRGVFLNRVVTASKAMGWLRRGHGWLPMFQFSLHLLSFIVCDLFISSPDLAHAALRTSWHICEHLVMLRFTENGLTIIIIQGLSRTHRFS